MKVTDEQVLELYEKHKNDGCGFKGKIADELGISKGSLSSRINKFKRSGLIPLDTGVFVDVGQILKGTSTLYSRDEDTGNLEVKSQWVKTDVAKTDAVQAFEEAIDGLVDRVRPVEPLPVPTGCTKDFMVKYPFADAHIGLLTWHKEVGVDFNLHKAELIYIEAMRHTVSLMPDSHECLILDLGDTIHTDDQSNTTKMSKHQLDVDGRFDKLYDVCTRILFTIIDIALQKHEIVRFRKTRGNHDPDTSIALARHLEAYYRNEPRVIVETSPSNFYWYKFGKTLHWSTHGHCIKQKDVPEIIAHDCKKVWTDVDYVYADTGHVHHQEVVETRTTKCESHNSMAAGDSYNFGHGYRSMRLMKGISYHKRYGEKTRNTVTVKEVEDMLEEK